MLDYDEVYEICKMSLARFRSEKVEAFFDEIAHDFAKFIYAAVDIDPEGEIPLELIKEVSTCILTL